MLGMLKSCGWLAVVWAAAAVSLAGGEGPSCPRCGSGPPVHKVCRPVCTTRLVTTTCWDYAIQDFCIPHKSALCDHTRDTCDPCESDCEAACPGTKTDGGKADSGDSCHAAAGCYDAVPRSRKRLIKTTHVERVPVTMWVTEYVCEGCGETILSKGKRPKGNSPVGKRTPPTLPHQIRPVPNRSLLIPPPPQVLKDPRNPNTGPVEFRLTDQP